MINPKTIIDGMNEKDKANLQKTMQEVHDKMAKATDFKDKMTIIRDLIDGAIKAQETYEKSKSNKVERPSTERQS